MKLALRMTLLSVVIALPLSADPGKEPQSIKGWGQVTDPDGDCKVAEKEGAVTITIPNTRHDLTYTDQGAKVNSPRLLQPVEGDFTLQVEIPAFPLPGNAAPSGSDVSFVSTGLLIWHDQKDFIRLERAAVAMGQGPFIWIERFQDGKSVSRELRRIADEDTGLRVVRKGKLFTFYFKSQKDQDWVEVHAEETELPAKLNVGVAAINTTDREFSPLLTGLKLELGK